MAWRVEASVAWRNPAVLSRYEQGDVKLVVFNGEDFGYWKN
jgi:hypothetical protein